MGKICTNQNRKQIKMKLAVYNMSKIKTKNKKIRKVGHAMPIEKTEKSNYIISTILLLPSN
jgi:hypothetical protein